LHQWFDRLPVGVVLEEQTAWQDAVFALFLAME
jgi:hypothetical protein